MPEGFPLPSGNREPQVPVSDAARRLARVLQLGAPANGVSTEHVREAVCDFVAELKDGGLPPEQVLIRVKAVVAAAHSSHSQKSDLERLFVQRLVTLCIEEYYRPR